MQYVVFYTYFQSINKQEKNVKDLIKAAHIKKETRF
jgi:hypothetical protein